MVLVAMMLAPNLKYVVCDISHPYLLTNFGHVNQFPYPSSPYITLVGGTMVFQDGNSAMYETGWDGSSGGFSGDFPVPSWQAAQIAAYLQQPGLPTSYFNGTGRGLPDLSAPGKFS
jgi:hypothetical protein